MSPPRALPSFAFLLLSGSAVAFKPIPSWVKPVIPKAAIDKGLAVGAAGVIAVATCFPGPAVAADSLVLGTPLESKLANFGAASYPVFNSITDVSPLAERFVEFVDTKITFFEAADVAQKAVNGLLAIPDDKVSEYAGVLKQAVYSGVSKDSCVTLGGSGAAAQKLAASRVVKSVDSSKMAALATKFKPANSAVPVKGGNICLPGSVEASEKLWVAQAELTFGMPRAEAGALIGSVKKAGVQATRGAISTLVPAAEGVFSKSPEAIKMVAAGKDVEPSVISAVKSALQ